MYNALEQLAQLSDFPFIGAESVEAAMQEIIATEIFELNGAPLATAVDARIIERNVTELVNG
ncbi:MAG TPA: DUF2922 domain-containing protein [Sporosarcina psychrophila]|uniref:DUF2922 domain-containing protein n=1 Tax=Sporosarcina psychrophila TaxID=1476 RepID=A0A921G2G9_SPOPS|nr:DUF2922 domain-containing protein [Sporosarcina psychrophila]